MSKTHGRKQAPRPERLGERFRQKFAGNPAAREAIRILAEEAGGCRT
jgi:hypothetical protein